MDDSAARGWPARRAATWSERLRSPSTGRPGHRRRDVSRRFAVVLVALATLVGLALPAQAATDVPGPLAPSTPVTLSLDGGAVLYTQAAAGVLSSSDCGAGYFCLWSLANYTGSMWQYTGSGSTFNLQNTAYMSYRNNRSQVAVLSSAPAGSTGLTFCIAPYGASSYVSGWPRYSESVYLALFQTAC